MKKPGSVRIIAGFWRGRRLEVPNLPGLRPTPDRVRETLFNWLSPYLREARCLDLFAGTGVLGFEALSRGASYVELIDQSPIIVRNLKNTAAMLGAKVNIHQAAVPFGLKSPDQPFDIVFLDPPYQTNLLLPTCFYLEENNWLKEKALLYLESGKPINNQELPAGWKIFKSDKAGDVIYQLVSRQSI